MTSSNALSRLRDSSGRRIFITLFAVAAVITGLLAMHFLSGGADTPMGDHGYTAAAPMAVATADVTSIHHGSSPVESTGCSDMCGSPTHTMIAMACLLALLVTAVLLLVHAALARWNTRAATVRERITAIVESLAPPAPPSLLVLSISRT